MSPISAKVNSIVENIGEFLNGHLQKSITAKEFGQSYLKKCQLFDIYRPLEDGWSGLLGGYLNKRREAKLAKHPNPERPIYNVKFLNELRKILIISGLFLPNSDLDYYVNTLKEATRKGKKKGKK